MISQWFAFADQQQLFPDFLAVNGKTPVELRYGENPHQKAALYTPSGPRVQGIAQAEQLQGKALSFGLALLPLLCALAVVGDGVLERV